MHRILYVLLLLASLLALGCSQGAVTPDTAPLDLSRPSVSERSNNWIWGSYKIAISADRSQAELLPARNSASHLNVTKLVEGPPCPSCLTIGKPHLQGDGTIKLQVWLSHPFQGHPEYTGFDVRGILVFESTDCYYQHYQTVWDDGHIVLMEPALFNYSDPLKGGAALLNADGYTFYLNPLLLFGNKPDIFNYNPGKHSYGEPDCTVNPYILFADGSDRRMFKTYYFFSRTFHIKPPSGGGEFEFGYVISACWAPPLNTPVTNPELDFPVEANCEDPYQIIVEQLQPISNDCFDQPLFKVTLKHRPGTLPFGAGILAPTISSSPDFHTDLVYIDFVRWADPPEYINYVDNETTEIFLDLGIEAKDDIGDGLITGWHRAMFFTTAEYPEILPTPPPSQLWAPIGVKPVMVYVEV